jgi:hypothetical protein
MGDMKPLILMLLLAISANAQSITDVARRERERKANTKPTAVLTTNTAGVPERPQPEVKSSDAKPEDIKPATVPAPAAPAKVAEQALKVAEQAVKVEDEALKRYNEELSRARAHVIELQDRQLALQLHFQDLKNTFLAPVTDPSARDNAQAQMTDTQVQIQENLRELAEAQRQVEVLVAQGPPKP